MQSGSHTRHPRLLLRGRPAIVCGPVAAVMAIINRSPDSFSDGGVLAHDEAALAHARAAVAAGAGWLDVGGESTRPGADPVTPAEERSRVVPLIEQLAKALPQAVISIDTSKATVAEAALQAGAAVVNDVRAGADPAMLPLVARHGAGLILMHMQGEPATMQQAPRYRDPVDEVSAFLEARLAAASAAGVAEESCLVDPGIGFGKRYADNCALLRHLPRIAARCGRPVVLGLSRKSFLPELFGRAVRPAERDHWSHLLHARLATDCAFMRVHDVPGAIDACRAAAMLGVADEGCPDV